MLTGGAGFIGSHVAEALLHRGVDLTIVDNLDRFYPRAWKEANLKEIRQVGKFELFELDICDERASREAFARSRPEIVVHLAARTGVRPSIEQPLPYEQVNVRGTINLLELCREYGVTKFLFGSSSSVYGDNPEAPFSEDQVGLRPISPYAVTKLAGEMLSYTYAHLFALPVICLRFFTVYGPRQRPDLAIYKFTALMEAAKAVPIFGDGLTGRDYTYVDDIVAGVLAALERTPGSEAAGPAFEVFNLGNSHPVKLADLVDLLEHVTGRKAILEYQQPQPGDMPLTWANISKATRLLGYHPSTQLEDGLARFVSWYRSTAPKLLA